MINTQRVAVFNHIEQLQEDVLDEFILANAPALMEDLGEETAILAVVHNDIREIFVLDETMEGNDIGTSGGKRTAVIPSCRHIIQLYSIVASSLSSSTP